MSPYSEEEMPVLWRYQQGNDLKHSFRLVRNWFLEKNVDLNQIEYLWEHLERKIRQRIFYNENALRQVLQDAWRKIPVDVYRNLIDSSPRRCSEVIKAKNVLTK